MIDVNNIHVVFNPGTPLENHALRGLSLRLEQGEFATVIGSNGAGKSTFLNVLAGEIIASQGTITIDDNDITQLKSHQRAPFVARVFQDPRAGTCDRLTIEENMSLAMQRGKRRGFGLAIKAERRSGFRDALATLGLGLENRLHDQIGLLSGGQRQAVSLLMAALADVSVLLLDEHTAALDPRTAEYVLKVTEDIVGRSRPTTIMITHSMTQALEYGTRTIMLDEGRVALNLDAQDRAGLTVTDLLDRFRASANGSVTEDALLDA